MHLRGVSGGACKQDEFSARLSGENGVRNVEKSQWQTIIYVYYYHNEISLRADFMRYVILRKIIYIKILISIVQQFYHK